MFEDYQINSSKVTTTGTREEKTVDEKKWRSRILTRRECDIVGAAKITNHMYYVVETFRFESD